MTLSSIAIEEKNKLGTTYSFLLALSITIPGVTDPVRIVRNNEDITWKGYTWMAFPFELDEIGDEAKGEVPQVNIRVSNVSRVMETYLQQYDMWGKRNGWSPIECTISVINTRVIASDSNADAEVEHTFELKAPKSNNKWATFVMGAPNPFNSRFPKNRIMKNQCRFIFKGSRCAYAGAETTCNKTLSRCRVLANSVRIGAFPGVGYGGVRIIN